MKQGRAVAILQSSKRATALLTFQALGEIYTVLVQKKSWDPRDARMVVTSLAAHLTVVVPTQPTLERAMLLVERHSFSFWDAQMLCVAAAGGCTHFLTEDMQDGQRLEASDVGKRMTILNPFNDKNLPAMRAAGIALPDDRDNRGIVPIETLEERR